MKEWKIGIIGVFSLLFGACSMGKQDSLFWGEFVVKQDGIYTYAHYYEHPETKRRVVFVGMNHGGDKEYFEAVAKILEEAEAVLYEGLPLDQEETTDEIQKIPEVSW